MPIVRLISPSADDARPVIEQLRALGYTVEILAPGESSDKHADLEISLEKHPSDEVLKRAAELTAGEMDVYIGAGMFPARSKTAVGPPPAVPTMADTVNGVARGLRNKRDLMAKALREQRAAMRGARQKVSDVATPAAEVSEIPIVPINPAPLSETLSESPLICRSERSEEPLLPPALPELPSPEPAAQSLEVTEAPVPAVLDAVAQPHVEAEAPVHEIEASELLSPAQSQAAPLAAGDSEAVNDEDLSAQAPVAAYQQVQEVAKPAEFSESPAELPPAVPAATVPQPAAPGVGCRPAIRASTVVVRVPRARRFSRAREWRIAVATSVIFAAILMVMWKRATQGPVSPLPRSLTQSNVEEQVPFGAVTLRPAAAAGQVANPQQQAVRPAPSTAANAPGSAKPSAAPKPSASKDASRTESKPAAAKPQRPERRSSADEDVAEDVIIRHFGPKPTAQKAKPKPENASLKRYSDLDY